MNQETKIELPKGFLLGAASSAHQVEGNNAHNDWWEYEQMGRLPRSGRAADHYNRYPEDFALAKEIGLNAMRISIEWSRIEPEEGKWAVAEIEHYKKVLRRLRELGMTRMVTLHHFTLPKWLADDGGFETKHGVQAFARFAWFVASNLGSEVDFWITINEPEGYVMSSYSRGVFPPFRKNSSDVYRVLKNLILAHKAAYRAIKNVIPGAQIGIAKNCAYYESHSSRFMDRLVTWFAQRIGNHYFLEKISKQMDFIGINYYFYRVLKFDWSKGYRLMPTETPKSDTGWETYPEGIYYLLKNYAKYNKPIYVTENGIADASDAKRKNFISESLYWVRKSMEFGADVKGYFYWSLTDTYEWEMGYDPKFGLVEVNFDTQERRIRKSAEIFKEVKYA